MNKEAKICITATDCGEGVLRDIHLEVNGRGVALMQLLRIQAKSLSERAGVPLSVLLAVLATMDGCEGETVTMDAGAIRKAAGKLTEDKEGY